MSSPISVLYIIGSLNPGGTEIHLLRVLPGLREKDIRPTVLTLSEPGMLAPQMQESGVEVIAPWILAKSDRITFRLLRLTVVCIQLFLYLVRRRFDILHFFLPASYLIGAPIALLARMPTLVMSRRSLNNYQRKMPRFVRRVEVFLHQRMSAILGNSHRVVRQMIEEENAPVERTLLFYNGILEPHVAPDCREKVRAALNIPKATIVMIMVANLIPYKGHSDLLDALAILPREYDFCLLLAGADSKHIQAQLEQQAEQHNLADRVKFLGLRNDTTELYAASDIGILSSHEEGFSNAILEGMMGKLPMVVTDVGGNTEAVINGETGFVVPPRSPRKLAQALEQLLISPQLRTRMGEKGYQRAQRLFTIDRCVDNYSDLYLALVEKRSLAPLMNAGLNDLQN